MRLDAIEQTKIAMKRAGVTQHDLSEATGIHTSALGKYLSGRKELTEAEVDLIGQALMRLAEEKIAALRAEAEIKARRMIESVEAVAA